MLPNEIRRLPFDESVVLVRGQKPAKFYKITPNKHPAFKKIVDTRIIDYFPAWKDEVDNVIIEKTQKPKVLTIGKNAEINKVSNKSSNRPFLIEFIVFKNDIPHKYRVCEYGKRITAGCIICSNSQTVIISDNKNINTNCCVPL